MSNGRNYTVALTHALLAGTSLWCIYKINGTQHWNIATGSFAVVCVNSIIGIWKYGNPEYGNKVDSLFELTDLAATMFALPALTANIYLHYGIEWMYSMLHLAAPCVPMVLFLVNEERIEGSLVDLIVFGNFISLGIISQFNKNYYGMYTAVMYCFNHFVLKKKDLHDVPREVMFNLGMCFYSYFAFHTLKDAHMIMLLYDVVNFGKLKLLSINEYLATSAFE